MARSTLCTSVHGTCEAIILTLMETFIKFPSREELKKVVDGFKNRKSFPQYVGAINGLHIPASASKLNYMDYYRRKG